jgi:lipid-A-disaccharide synthase-like uncharacterized protein
MLANWFFEDLIDPLGLFGLAAQAMFMLRFVVQWFASERRGRSYVPVAFWYFSLIGGLMTLTYAYLRQEPVFMLAQALGITIYVRNLVLIYRRRSRYSQRRLTDEQVAGESPAPDSSLRSE